MEKRSSVSDRWELNRQSAEQSEQIEEVSSEQKMILVSCNLPEDTAYIMAASASQSGVSCALCGSVITTV